LPPRKKAGTGPAIKPQKSIHVDGKKKKKEEPPSDNDSWPKKGRKNSKESIKGAKKNRKKRKRGHS